MKAMTVSILMTDGTSHDDVPVTMRDKLRYSETRARRKWPNVEDDPFRFMTFIAWAAAKREGLIDNGMTFDAFADNVADIDIPGEDEAEDIDPT